MCITKGSINRTSTSRPNDSGIIHTIHHWRNNLQQRETKRKLLSLPPKWGGLNIPLFTESCQVEDENPVKLTERLCAKIINQTRQYEVDDKSLAITNKIRLARQERNKEQLQNIRSNLSEQKIRSSNINLENGVSNWLTTLLYKNEGYVLTKAIIFGFNPYLLWLGTAQSLWILWMKRGKMQEREILFNQTQ